jgi:hypothetical protein
MNRNPSVKKFLSKLAPADRIIVQALRQVMHDAHPSMQEYWPYTGTSLFFRLHGPLGYLNYGHTLKLREPLYIGFTKGCYIEDVSPLLRGRGTHKVIRYVPLPHAEFVSSEPFLEIVNAAVQYNLNLMAGKSKAARLR